MVNMSKTLTLRESFNRAARSRVFVVLWVIIALLAIVVSALTIIMGHIGQPGTPVRYDGFSSTGISLDNGLYLVVFAIWAILIAVLNIFISLKVYGLRGRQMALMVLWFTVALLLIATVFIIALLGAGSAY